ncbi:hypothetical protein EIP86_000240 [Pleurotus ostreatoroseus]|nr:hypothetical protein EIP86_000240 [Pleurotus ostreatoroseus]
MSGHHGNTSAATTTSLSPSASASKAAAAASKALRKKLNTQNPKQLWWFLACTIGVAMFLNIFSILWAFKRRRDLKRPSSPPAASSGKVSLKRLPAAALTASRILAFRWRIPAVSMTLLEVFLTSMYLMAVLIWEFVNTSNLAPTFWANRAGHIAASQFPLIVGLATKNNAIEFLTGISHEKVGVAVSLYTQYLIKHVQLNLMHRAISRVMLLMVWIHWWGRVSMSTSPKGSVSQPWRVYGLVAGILQTIITFISIAPIRKRFYEFFFLTHVVLVFVTLVLSHLHCADPGYAYYIWPCWIIWGLDRVSRWLRYAILTNFHSPNKSPAELELVNHDTIRITVRRWVPFGWRAGQHMFLAFPTLGPVESHPFTIATIPEGEGKEMEMVYIVRARDGFTKRLREHIVDKDGLCRAPVFMDGPYGAPPDITVFDTCVFFAGGSGVTYTMSRMRELVNAVHSGKACAKRIVWVWAVRHYCELLSLSTVSIANLILLAHINWLGTELKKTVTAVPDGVDLSIMIYVTTGTSANGSATQTLNGHEQDVQEKDADPEKDGDFDEKNSVEIVNTTAFDASLDMKDVTVVSGRPDMRKILEDSVTTSTGPVSVDVSGPDSLVASIRTTLSSSFASPIAVLKGTPTVQLNIESFTM